MTGHSSIDEINETHRHEHNAPLESLLRFFRARKVASYIPSGAKVLDLGCGHDAYFLEQVKDKISEAVGVDLVLPVISDHKIKLVSHDLNLPVPFSDNSFDVVVSLASLEHLRDYEAVIIDMKRVLKPGGVLLLTTPSIYAKPVLEFLSFRLGLISKELMREHTGYFSKKKLTNLMQAAHFSKFTHSYFECGMNNFVYAVK